MDDWWVWAQPRGHCSYCGGVSLWITQDGKEYCPGHLFIAQLKDLVVLEAETAVSQEDRPV